jgi:hypothetical protein
VPRGSVQIGAVTAEQPLHIRSLMLYAIELQARSVGGPSRRWLLEYCPLSLQNDFKPEVQFIVINGADISFG